MSVSNSAERPRTGSLSFHQSIVEKSIIAQLPESFDYVQKISNLTAQVLRLNEELEHYRQDADSNVNTGSFKTNNLQEKAGRNDSSNEYFKSQQLMAQNQTLKKNIEEQNAIIKKISEELRFKKRNSQNQINTYERERLEQENNNIRDHMHSLQKEIDSLRRLNLDQQVKISELNEEVNSYAKEVDMLNQSLQKIRKQNVIDRKRNEQLRVVDKSHSRYSIMQNSRTISQMDLLDNERYNIKLTQRNKEYEQLYFKYQNLQNQHAALEELNQELEQERRFLAERLSDIEIHTEGDQVVGELENKLVLMSTELMRLGNLSRTKTQESKDLSIRVKELLLKKQHLQKDLIERDKLILNYKEELRSLQMRMGEKSERESKRQSRVKDDRELKELKQKNNKFAKDMQKLTSLYKQKLQSLKNAEIRNAIFQEKNIRLTKQFEEVENQNRKLVSNNDKNKSISTQILNFQAEINYYKESNANLKDEVRRLEGRVQETRIQKQRIIRQKQEWQYSQTNWKEKFNSAQQDIRRQMQKADDKQTELKQTNHHYEQKLIEKTNQIRRLEEQIGSLEKQIQRGSKARTELSRYEELIREVQRYQRNQLGLKLQISQYQEKLALLAQQHQRLTQQLKRVQEENSSSDRLKNQIEQKDKRLRQLNKEVQSLSLKERRYREEADNLRDKLRSTLINERETQTLQFQNRQVRDQVDALRTQLSVKEEELRNVLTRYQKEKKERQTLFLKNQQLNSRGTTVSTSNQPQTQSLERQIRRLKEMQGKQNSRMVELEKKERQSDQIYSALSGEIQRLNKVLGEKIGEIGQLKKQIDFLQHKVRTCENSLEQRKQTTKVSSQKQIAEFQSKTKIQFCQGKLRDYQGQLQILRQRCSNLKQTNSIHENKIQSLVNQKLMYEQRINQLQFQGGQKSASFRRVEESFRMTIMEIKGSNQRLEQSMKQIQTHYISRLQSKQIECANLRNERKQIQTQFHQLQKRLTSKQAELGSQIRQKNIYINNLSNNHNQTKEQAEMVKKLKGQYEVKVALLSQQVQRLTSVKNNQFNQLQRLKEQIRQSQNRFTSSMKESTANVHTIDTLSIQIQRLNTVLMENVEKLRQNKRKTAKLENQINTLRKEKDQIKLQKTQTQRRLTHQKQMLSNKYQQIQINLRQITSNLQEKARESSRWQQKVQQLQNRQQGQTNTYMKSAVEQLKLLRQTNQGLEKKLGLMNRQYEQLVVQLEHYRRPKSNQQDQKMRIIGNYEATIQHMKEQVAAYQQERTRLRMESTELNKLSHQFQQRNRLSQQRARAYEDKSRRLEDRNRTVEERNRSLQETLKIIQSDKTTIEQKMMSAMEEVGRLQLIIKSKEENQKIQSQSQYYNNGEAIRDKKGIFVIKEVSEMDERSRSASGNGPQPIARQPGNSTLTDLQHRYQLLQSINRKLTGQSQCIRRQNVQYEFKMNKLKEEFALLNRLVHQYREENDKLKEKNRLQQGQRSNHFVGPHSQFSSPQHSSIVQSIHRSSVSPQLPVGRRGSEIGRQGDQMKIKLLQEIDRLSRVNSSLQNEVRDLRLNSSDNISLRKRLQQNLGMIIEALRLRVREGQRVSSSPVKLR